jgi:hypothetical protein
VKRTINTPATQQRRIRSIHNRVDVEGCYIAANRAKVGCHRDA